MQMAGKANPLNSRSVRSDLQKVKQAKSRPISSP
jgi:hypothetical protein